MTRIIFTNPDNTQGRMIWAGGEVFGPLPPLSGEFRPIYDRLIAAGVEPEPYLAPPDPVPQMVSRFQARAALMLAGKLDAVQAAVDASGDPLVALAWSEAVEFRRDSPTIAALGAGIGLTEAEINDLFRRAAAITA